MVFKNEVIVLLIVTADSKMEHIDEISGGTEKLSLSDAPKINRSLIWVTPDSIDFSKVSLSAPIEARYSTKIRKVMYKYPHLEETVGKSDLALVPVLEDDDLLLCHGVYAQNGLDFPGNNSGDLQGSRGVKHVCKLEVDLRVPSQAKFFEMIAGVRKLTETLINRTVSGYGDLTLPVVKTTDGNRVFIYAELIETAGGIIHSQAYDASETLDIKKVGRSRVRPSLIFSNTERNSRSKSGSGGKLKIKISQIYVHEQVGFFPLAKYNECPGE